MYSSPKIFKSRHLKDSKDVNFSKIKSQILKKSNLELKESRKEIDFDSFRPRATAPGAFFNLKQDQSTDLGARVDTKSSVEFVNSANPSPKKLREEEENLSDVKKELAHYRKFHGKLNSMMHKLTDPVTESRCKYGNRKI